MGTRPFSMKVGWKLCSRLNDLWEQVIRIKYKCGDNNIYYCQIWPEVWVMIEECDFEKIIGSQIMVS